MSPEGIPDPRKAQRRLETAYLSVFGPTEARSEDQRLVMEDLENFCRAFRPAHEVIAGGAYPENNYLVNEGRRTVWIRIRGHVLSAQGPNPELVRISRKPKKKE